MSQLTNYIQKELDKGFGKELITKKLLQAGYTQQEITESFKSLKSAEPLLRRKLIDTIHEDAKVIRSKWLFSLVGIILLVGLVYLILQYVSIPAGTVCDDIADVQEKDICYLELAANGEEMCEKIERGSYTSACKAKVWESADCVYEILIGEDKDACLMQQALETKDTTFCYYQEDFRLCLIELARRSGDLSFCENNMMCILTFAVEEKNPLYCQEYVTDDFQRDCYDNYIEQTGDIQQCIYASFGCGYHSSDTEEERRKYIEENENKLPSEMSIRDDALIDYTLELDDVLLCDYVSETFMYENITSYDLCIITYAVNKNDKNVCSQVNGENIQLCEHLLSCNEDPQADELCRYVQ